MLQLLPMLLKQGQPQQQGQEEGNGTFERFLQALGADNMGKGSQKIGMQYQQGQQMQTPDASQLLASIMQPQQQQQKLETFNPLLQMLAKGGQ